ncbi:MAG: GNAT family N-acetyltransferase [Ruminococcaceae bacterium]|nr:GNAT family N-acetyltransferase [Oscillospiraceae bacterium]
MLRLRPYKRCDAQHIASWIKSEYVFRQWCADRYESYPIRAEDINAHYDAVADSDDFYEMTAFDENGVVGHLIMRFVDAEKSVLRFGFVIVDDTKRGKGYGKEMLLLAQRYAFDILKASKITLGVFANNPAALYCYRAAGFREVNVEEAESYMILGETWECIEMELYAPQA